MSTTAALTPETLDELFADLPQAQQLLADVREFYGAALQLHRRDNHDGISQFSVDQGRPGMPFQHARIVLNFASDRVREAGVHELLHLALPSRGFNVPGSLTGQLTDAQFAEVDQVLKKAINIVQHDIFVGEYLAMGLSLERFMARRRDNPQYRALARRLRGRVTPWDRSMWAFEYLNNQLGRRHGDPEAERLSEACLQHGEGAMPDYPATAAAAAIDRWIAKVHHRNTQTYIGALRELFTIIQLPAGISFCRLDLVAGRLPAVTHL